MAERVQVCNYCHRPGHVWKDCAVRTEKMKTVQCYNCMKFGHFSKNCVNEAVCRVCLEPGHEARTCKKKRNRRFREKSTAGMQISKPPSVMNGSSTPIVLSDEETDEEDEERQRECRRIENDANMQDVLRDYKLLNAKRVDLHKAAGKYK